MHLASPLAHEDLFALAGDVADPEVDGTATSSRVFDALRGETGLPRQPTLQQVAELTTCEERGDAPPAEIGPMHLSLPCVIKVAEPMLHRNASVDLVAMEIL